MAFLYLRREIIGHAKAVLLDKDGTISYSQPNIEILAHLRIFHCQQSVTRKQRHKLKQLLSTAYGLCQMEVIPMSAIAVASRHHNLISTTTAFCQIGTSWSHALKESSTIFQLTDKYHRDASHFVDNTTGLILPWIKSLHNQGIICGVISNDTKTAIWQFLRHHELDSFVRIVWSANQQPSKPDPKILYHICDILQLQPVECAVISDADTDLYMAEKAGIGLVLGYTGGWTTKNILHFGSYQFDDWSELEVIDDL
ncbi:Haloacid dehalogenase_epoxide hydrolase family protein (chromatophore) [Paulinella micropora]|uniref:Haloacid dehalogenase_epoxide hydrolase family protein n=1 Tax=Paulinella micropora TaxID=1928728 RepID=A0A1L5YCE3_9EUKA|nr:hypothetical protein PCKR_619 [Paulinella micropora]AQX45160.1 hypothetical protein PFK_619 [Paulinella micropora]BBL86377.1 Haloacid dehalogenase_epoxide hydrolase family protein [Paulinella micropora]